MAACKHLRRTVLAFAITPPPCLLSLTQMADVMEGGANAYVRLGLVQMGLVTRLKMNVMICTSLEAMKWVRLILKGTTINSIL